jgi:hypothetical protein
MDMAGELENRPQRISILSEILYDTTTTTTIGVFGTDIGSELGNEITLAADTPRWANEFYFTYRGVLGQPEPSIFI